MQTSHSGSPKQPPLDGSIDVLPGFIDFHAENNPDLPWALLAPESTGAPTPVPFSEYANATHRAAYALRPDPTTSHREVVALFVHCDTILYHAAIAGAVRAGLIPLPMSPKNSVAAVANLLEKTSCHRIISQPMFQPVMSALQSSLEKKHYPLRVDPLPELHTIFPNLSGGTADTVPYPKVDRPSDPTDVVLILHSSGSTGLPKPVPQRRCDVLNWCGQDTLLESRKRGIVWGSMALPTFHTMAMYMQFYCPLSSGYPVVLYPPKAPASPVTPTPQNMLDACKRSGVSGIPMVPAFIEVWAQSDEDVAYLASLKVLIFAGGPLSQTNGDKLVKAGVNLFAVYGGTEFGVHTRVFDTDPTAGPDSDVKSKEDWAWMTFQERVRPNWVPQGDGTYEVEFLTCETHSPALTNLPDGRGYATGDLFVQHPKKKGLWRMTGRKDDVLVLSSGEKVVPLPQEGSITANRMVSGAVVFGYGKNQCGVLIEPSPQFVIDPKDAHALVEFRNRIWPVVDQANGNAPTFARVFKEMILVTDPVKPLPRAAKSTIIRKQSYALYADEIENLYATIAQSADANGIDPPASWSADDVEGWLVQHSVAINGDANISPTMDLFDQGFDSLHATFLRNRIIGALRSSHDGVVRQAAINVPQNIVYDYSTLSELAVAVAALVDPTTVGVQKDRLQLIQELIDKYSYNIITPSYKRDVVNSEDIVVLLTGSTGNVGSHVLAGLLMHPKVIKVYTLNRGIAPVPGEDRQRVAFEMRGLSTALLDEDKVVQLYGDLTREGLGLQPVILKELTSRVTHIIHNAWRVDFNRALSSFDSHIAGTRRLVDLCAKSAHPVKLLFTSSIAAAQSWPVTNGRVPETPLSDPTVAAHTGYGASKFVAENLLGRAASAGLPCTTLRVGQISGAADTGFWSTSEWVPTMLKSSLALRALPSLDGAVSWIPLGSVTSVVVDLLVSDKPLPPLLNVVHPRPVPWNTIIAAFNNGLGETLPIVPYTEWLSKLETVAGRSTNEDLESTPAITLLPFFRGIASSTSHAGQAKDATVEAGGQPMFDTIKLRENCPSVSDLRALDSEDVCKWVAWWKSAGFLNV